MNDLDKPQPEVVVDVLVLEASRSTTRDLAVSIASATSSGVQAGLTSAIQFTPRNPIAVSNSSSNSNSSSSTTATTTTTSNAISTTPVSSSTNQLMSLARIARLSTNDFSITMPGALLNFVVTDSSTKILQSPQVRAINGQKASLRIGDKVPVAQGGFQTLAGTTGGYNSLYSQFQFVDVGVNVDITPTVHRNDEVTLKVVFEISTVREYVNIGGIEQPVIGHRKVEHEIRIRAGEVSLLGGLMQDQDTKTVSGVPGLASIPILRRLFMSENIDHGKSELLIALIPHIVRKSGITDLNLRAVATGSDQNVKVNLTPQDEAVPAPEHGQDAEPPHPSSAPPATAAPAKSM